MARTLREYRCWNGDRHVAEAKIAYKDEWSETQESRCIVCRQPLSRFWIDEEPGERAGGWSQWCSKAYVIEEIGP